MSCLHLLFDQGRERFGRIHPEAGGEAVSEKNDCLRGVSGCVGRWCFGKNCCRKKAKAERNSVNCCHRSLHAGEFNSLNPLRPSMTPLPILDVQSLTKTYTTGVGKLTVLKDISFSLPQGATCATGPSATTTPSQALQPSGGAQTQGTSAQTTPTQGGGVAGANPQP